MNYLSKAKIATQNLEDGIISHQDWAADVLGSGYRDMFSDEYLRRAAKVFGIFLKNADEQDDGEQL